MSMLMQRRLGAVGERLHPLSAAAARSAIEQWKTLRTLVREHSSRANWIVQSRDISSMTPAEVKTFFGSLAVDKLGPITIIWPSELAAASIRFGDFVRSYDDLWFPSRDDVALVGPDASWLLEISHEEVVTFASEAKAGN